MSKSGDPGKTEMESAIMVDIQTKIYAVRGLQVMLDRDLAKLYDVETRILNQAVKRNHERFPEEFCFQFTKTEFEKWKSQFVMSNADRMGLRKNGTVLRHDLADIRAAELFRLDGTNLGTAKSNYI